MTSMLRLIMKNKKKHSPLILSEGLEEEEREAGADCTECAWEEVEQVDDDDSLLALSR